MPDRLMDIVDLDPTGRPTVAPDATSQPFFAAAAVGELIYQRCPQCDHAQHYPRMICTACGATPEWHHAAGTGTMYSFTVIRQNGVAPFKSELPYVLAMVELPEGVRMMGTLTGCDPEAVQIGMAVEAYAAKLADDVALVYWRPLGQQTGPTGDVL